MGDDPIKRAGEAALVHARRVHDVASVHQHEEVMLFFPIRGRIVFDIEGVGALECDERHVVCVMDRVDHAHRARDESVEYLVVFLDARLLRDVIGAPVQRPAWRFTQTLFLREAAAQLCGEAGSDAPRADVMASACVQVLCVAAARGLETTRLARDPWRPLPADERVARAVEFARERAVEFPSVDVMAKEAGMSRRTLERAFSKQIGATPRRFLEEVRCFSAREMLLASEASVTEIAFEVGYKDLSHFIRAYQSVFGESPTETRYQRMSGLS